jgi:uncharacterized YigZ family protein
LIQSNILSAKHSYQTIGTAPNQEIKEKGSKFIGLAKAVVSEDEVKEVIQSWRDEHSQATHVCTAFRLGLEGELYRYSDDGEPSNSAGTPIYGQLLSFDLTNVLVGVVRYYGGTKLGVGGLKSAYKEAAKAVLETAEKIERHLYRRVIMSMSYEDMPHVMSILKRNRIDISETEMTNSCTLHFALPADDELDFGVLLYEYDNVEINELGIY